VQFRRRVQALAVVVGLLALAGSVTGVAASEFDTMRIEPASLTVAEGDAFSVTVVHGSPIAVGGAEASVTFDPALLQVVSVTPGGPYASAPIFLPHDVASSIAAANARGKLATIAAAFLRPAFAPASPSTPFLVIELKAVGCGQAVLGLPAGAVDATMLDGRTASYGQELTVGTTGATITIACSGAAGPAAARALSGAAGSGSSAASALPAHAAGTDGPPVAVIALVALAALIVAAVGLFARGRRA
jgi:hypothetical protein